MAYVTYQTRGGILSGPASFSVTPPPSDSGDFQILSVLSVYRTITTPSGWTLKDQAISAGNYIYTFYKTSTGSVAPFTVSLGSAGSSVSWMCTTVKDVDTAAPFDNYAKAAFGTGVLETTSPAITTNTDNCLLLHFGAVETRSITPLVTYPRFYSTIQAPSDHTLTMAQSIKPTAGAVTQSTWLLSASDRNSQVVSMALKNATGGKMRAWAEDNRELLVDNRAALWGTAPTINAPNSVSGLTAINGKPMHTAVAQRTTSFTFTGWSYSWAWNDQTNLAANAWVGGFFPQASAKNLVGAVVHFNAYYGSLWDSARQGDDGSIIVFVDSLNNWAAFQIHSLVNGKVSTPYSFYLPVDTMTPWQSSATQPVWSDIVNFGYFYERKSGTTAATYIGTNFVSFSKDPIPVYGDTLNASTIKAAIPHSQTSVLLQGNGQLQSNLPLQIGSSLKSAQTALAANSIEFPKYDATYAPFDSGRMKHVVRAYSSSDVINYYASIQASDTNQTFEIHASSDTSASYNFAGCSIVGYTVTWKTGVPCSNATFVDCYEIDMKGADMTNCIISNPQSTEGLIFTESGATLDGCTIEAGSDYHIELGTSVTAITLTDVTFTGTPAVDKVHVLKTSGTVTITIAGTTNLVSGDVTSAGATVVIDAPQPTLSATVLASTRVVLYNRTTSTELDNTFVTGTGWSKIITSGASTADVLDLYTFKEGYAESVATIIYAGSDASFAVEQPIDTAIQYYRTEESITDYTTLSEFDFYAPDIYILSDDPDGAGTLKRLFIYYNGVLTTEDGARYMRNGITFRSPFDVVINRSVTPIAVDNVSATMGLYFTDEATIRVTTDDGTSWIAPPSAPGSIRYAFGVAPGQVETGVSGLTGAESSKLMGLPSETDNAAAVIAAAEVTPITANVVMVAYGSVDGSGSEIDPWGPVG